MEDRYGEAWSIGGAVVRGGGNAPVTMKMEQNIRRYAAIMAVRKRGKVGGNCDAIIVVRKRGKGGGGLMTKDRGSELLRTESVSERSGEHEII